MKKIGNFSEMLSGVEACASRDTVSRTKWNQMALASLVAFSGPKKVSNLRAHPLPMALVIDVARIKFKIITSRAI
jgi:hypothetical protein